MKHTRILIACIVATTLISCNLNSGDDEEEIGSIESNVLVQVFESHLEIGPPSVAFHFQTEDMEPCSNYDILNEFSISGEVIVNDFEGIFRPNLCTEPGGPATSTNFTDLQNGEYLLEINYEENTDLYNVAITEDSITVNAEESNFTSAPFEVSWRFPENSFALLCGTADGSSAPCDDFEGILADSLNLQETTFPDSGYVPYPQSTSDLGADFEYDAPALYFIYNTRNDFEEAVTLLGEYDTEINAAASGVAIFMMNWEGEQYLIGQ
ncbi:MAG: hypothetical protein WEB89_06240 [Balneolales bacterium]